MEACWCQLQWLVKNAQGRKSLTRSPRNWACSCQYFLSPTISFNCFALHLLVHLLSGCTSCAWPGDANAWAQTETCFQIWSPTMVSTSKQCLPASAGIRCCYGYLLSHFVPSNIQRARFKTAEQSTKFLAFTSISIALLLVSCWASVFTCWHTFYHLLHTNECYESQPTSFALLSVLNCRWAYFLLMLCTQFVVLCAPCYWQSLASK